MLNEQDKIIANLNPSKQGESLAFLLGEYMKVILNPDNEIVKMVRQALKENDGYCPCKLTHIPDNKCMCKEFREQAEGECHCGLYIKING